MTALRCDACGWALSDARSPAAARILFCPECDGDLSYPVESLDPHPSDARLPEGQRIGRLALQRGWITQAQLDACLAELQVGYAANQLVQILLRRRLIDARQLTELLRDARSAGRAVLRDDTVEHAPPVREFGKYRLLEEVARGGMGIVYRALDPNLRREVALKILQLHSEDQQIRRFQREAGVAGKLVHPNIIGIHEFGQAPHPDTGRTTPYIAMDYVRGRTLQAMQTGMPLTERILILQQVAAAVGFAHSKGVVHRDIKPANILLAEEDGRPIVTDFGLARSDRDWTKVTGEQTILGTLLYMSPEQVQGDSQAIDARADVWALGVVLYQMLCNTHPFPGTTAVEILGRIAHQDPVDPRAVHRGVPSDLAAVCLKALAKQPASRYPDARAMADDLLCWLQGTPVAANPLDRVERARRWIVRRPGLFVLALLTCVMALAGLEHVLRTRRGLEATRRRAQRRSVEAKLQQRRALERITRRRQLVYVNRFSMAVQAWRTATPERARALLASLRPAGPDAPDHRGYEWHHLWGLLHKGRLLRSGAADVSGLAALGAQGALFAFSQADSIEIWRLSDGSQPRRSFQHGLGLISALCVARVARRVAVAGLRGVVVWDVAAGKELLRLRLRAPAWGGLALSDDGLLVAAAGPDGVVGIWRVDRTDGQPLRRIEGAGPRQLAFSPDGSGLAVAGRRSVALWETGSAPSHVRCKLGGGSAMLALGYSPAGDRVFAGLADGSVVGWSATDGSLTCRLKGHLGGVRALGFLPDGRLVSGAADNSVRIWDVERERSCALLQGHSREVQALAYDDAGKRLLSGSASGAVRAWAADDMARRGYHLPSGQTHRAVAFAADGRFVATSREGAGGEVTIRRPGSGAVLARLLASTGAVQSLAYSDSGSLLAAGTVDGDLAVFERRESGWARRFRKRVHDGAVWVVVFSQDGSLLISGGEAGKIVVSTAWGDKKARATVRGDRIKSLLILPGGKRVLARDDGGRLTAYGLDLSPQEAPRLSAIRSFAACSRRGMLALGTETGEVVIFEPATGRELQRFKAHRKAIYHAAFAPDGRTLATAGADFRIKLWQVATASLLDDIEWHTEAPLALRFSKDGKTLLSASIRSVRAW